MKRAFELNKFGEPNFSADEFKFAIILVVKSTFDPSIPNSGKLFNDTLSTLKQTATTDLQKNVYKNYKDLTTVSKEISQLSTDMNTLKSILGELRQVHEVLKSLSPGDRLDESLNVNMLSAAFVNARKQSILPPSIIENDQEQFIDAYGKQWRNTEELNEARRKQIKELYDIIDNLYKVMPTQASRYLVKDGSILRFTDVSKKPVDSQSIINLYIFNDCLLIANRKKSMLTGKSKISAEKMLKWTEFALIDLKDIDSMNDVKIMKHPDQIILRAETQEMKRLLLVLMKKLTEDQLNLEKRDLKSPTPINESPTINQEEKPTRRKAILSSEKRSQMSEKEYRFLTELPDDLDVLIVNRDFEQAVASIEKAEAIFKAHPGEATNQFTKMEQRKLKLANLISLELANPDLHRKQVKWNIDRLLRLGLGEQARDIFLTARSMTIRHRLRQLKFVGDVSSYVKDLSEIVFKLIRNTCDWYGASFREAYMASGFIKWVQDEIENYAQVFRRQVFEIQDFETIAECLNHTMTECMQLKEVGLDLSFVLDKLFYNDLIQSIDLYASKILDRLQESLTKDQFTFVTSFDQPLQENWIRDFGEDEFKLSQSAFDFYAILIEFGENMRHLMSIPLYMKIVDSLKALFSFYFNRNLQLFDRDWSMQQHYCIMVSSGFVVDVLMPRVASQLAVLKFDRPIPELEEHCFKMQSVIVSIQSAFVRLSCARLISKDYPFQQLDYTSGAAVLENAKISDFMNRLLVQLNKISIEMPAVLDKKTILSDIISRFFQFMTEDRCWENDKGQPRKFGFGGVQQLILDMHMFLRVCDQFVDENANELANSVCEKALILYFQQNAQLKAALKSGEWYDERVEDMMKSALTTFEGLTQ